MRVLDKSPHVEETTALCKRCECLFGFWPHDVIWMQDGTVPNAECPVCGWFHKLSESQRNLLERNRLSKSKN